tara:strand:+ start:152 stop:367 length:216 start_codon:yes stop_codon:yes gene_type:complete
MADPECQCGERSGISFGGNERPGLRRFVLQPPTAHKAGKRRIQRKLFEKQQRSRLSIGHRYRRYQRHTDQY